MSVVSHPALRILPSNYSDCSANCSDSGPCGLVAIGDAHNHSESPTLAHHRRHLDSQTLKLFVMDSISLNQTTGKQTTDIIVDDAVDGMPGLESTSKKCKSKELTSDVWNFFTKIGVDADGTHKAKCNGCLKEFRSGGKQNGISSLRRHREICRMLKSHDLRQMFVTNEGKLASRKVDPNIARELLAYAVIKHDLPFSFVEYDGIRKWRKYLNPDVPSISRNTLVSDITKIYFQEKEKLKQVLANIKNRICLTSDVWTACTSEGYIYLTGHFVDENWKLNSKILCFAKMPPPHTGVELAAKIYQFLKEWGIERKVFSLTLDNASCNDTMQEIVKEQLTLNESLLCDGEFFHIRCSAHILNLIVQEGLKVVTSALHKIRESVKYVKGSEGRMKKFEECIGAIGNIDTSIGLRLDVVTRWNSTYLMLDSAIKYKRAFASLQLNDRHYKFCPSNEEWKRGEKICEFLEPFYEVTNLISGSSYSTSNLYFMQVWKIESMLKDNLHNEDVLICDMCKKMFEKFDKYWSEYSIVLAFGAIFDPRIKLVTLEHLYEELENDTIKVQDMISRVKAKLNKLFSAYADVVTPRPSQPRFSQVSSSSMQREGVDVLAIPITTVASESAFSIGARVLTKYRSCTLPEKVQALICTRNWLHGYAMDTEEISSSTSNLSCEDSNIVNLIDEYDDNDGNEEA
nr:zinc finger BED domain-containing protein RICESLEEPER 2-like [Ipomoea batatas]